MNLIIAMKMIRLIGGISYELYLIQMKILNLYFSNLYSESIFVCLLLVFIASVILKQILKLLKLTMAKVKLNY
jgi:peptidoglycan/LPS O-acetylase OafA/YrhL